MSTPESNVVALPDNTPQPPLSFEVKEFSEGVFKGFKYTVPVFNELDAAVKAFGEDTILSLFNTQAAARIRTKVTNDLPDTKKLKESEVASVVASRLAATQGMLYTEVQAKDWKPEVRELTPKQLFKKAQELFKAGDVIAGQAMLVKMSERMAFDAQLAAGVPVSQ